jgi:hypothetical protein
VYRGPRPAAPPHRIAPRQHPPVHVAPGHARAYRAPAQAAPAQKAPMQPRTTPQAQQSRSPWSAEPVQQPAWATKAPGPKQAAP